jgi:TP901 family phage tail tape measure protein
MSKVRAGQAFVEIGADTRKLFAALGKAQRQIGKFGAGLSQMGGRMAGVGAGLAAPFVASAVAGARFQDVLLNVQASTGATAAELDQVRKAAMAMSQSLGVGPTEAAAGFLELLKAGLSLEQVLGGAGKAAIAFAKVGQMAVADAAVVMADAMNVFKVTGDVAANTLSAAADASSTSIEGIAQAFSQVSAVAGLANQSIQDTAASLAVLANAGIKGSDAGTSLKTMLMRLMAPAEDAVGALEQVGLSVQSFRNADGTMKPMVAIIGTLTTALEGMDQAAKDDIFRRIFGQDAIRAAAVMTAAGVDGFNAMRDGMGGAMAVGDKFATMQSGLSGATATLFAAMQRLAIAVSDAVGPALMDLASLVRPLIDGFTKFVLANKELVGQVAAGVAVFTAVGVAMIALGGTLSFVSASLSAVVAPVGIVFSAVSGLGSAFVSSALAVGSSMATAGASIARFATSGASQLSGFAASGIRSVANFGSAVSGVFASQFRIARFVGGTFAGSVVTAFQKAAMSIGPLRSAVLGIAPAVGFVGKGVVALASDASRLAAPLAQPFVAAGSAVVGFATSAATATGSYVAGLASTVAATVAANAAIAAAWIGGAARAVAAFAAQAAAALGAYIAPVIAAVTATVASAAGIAGAWLATAFPATAAFVAGAATSLGTYIASTVAALAASVTSAAGIAVAWIAAGMPGIVAFVGTAVAGLATYLAACAAAVAGSVASAAAVAAAWLAPLAPFLAIGAAIAGAGALLYAFGGQAMSALGGIGELAGSAGSAIGSAFGSVVSDAIVVFTDLGATAKTTFGGIYEAIAGGDLQGAMEIAMAGLYAAWARGSEAIMGSVDSWAAFIQNTVTYMWANIKGVFGDSINWVLNAFDDMVSAVQQSWNYVQSFIKKGFDLAAENKKVTDATTARKQERAATRGSGVEMRAADGIAAGRLDENTRRADERRANTVAAEDRLGGLVSGQRDQRIFRAQADAATESLGTAGTMDEVRALAEEFHLLAATGKVTQEQLKAFSEAAETAQDRIEGERGAAGAAAAAPVDPEAVKMAATAAAASQSEVAGSFSAASISGMGFGQSLAQKQLDTLKEIAANTALGGESLVAA